MHAQEIRETFLEFFLENKHLIIPGASLVPVDDPTLLLINSGMAPMKTYFSGKAQPPSSRMCNVQKCLRTNDIEDVGDIHHLTFFEMLGSWSIGDYFKEVAIDLATELLIDRFKIPQDKLYVTVYSGNEDKGIPYDTVSHGQWKRLGFKQNQIVPLGDEDNFWGPAGDAGPCGPCTEVFIDMGPEYGPSYAETGHFDTKHRYVEIWNAGVFMEFEKDKEGLLTKLPFTSVDTGSGLERLAIPLNGYRSVYDGEPYTRIMETLSAQLSEKQRRVIADHSRAVAHLISDGVYPGKNGREYVARKLIRRIETANLQTGIAVPYKEVLDAVFDYDGQNHPSLLTNRKTIESVIGAETKGFGNVLKSGSKAVKKAIEQLSSFKEGGEPVLSGRQTFNIVSSVGLPIDALTQIAESLGYAVDQKAYEACSEEHRSISRSKKPHSLPEPKLGPDS